MALRQLKVGTMLEEVNLPANYSGWVPFNKENTVNGRPGNSYGIDVPPGIFSVTILLDGVTATESAVLISSTNAYTWGTFTSGVAKRMAWKEAGQLRIRNAQSTGGGTVTVIIQKIDTPPRAF